MLTPTEEITQRLDEARGIVDLVRDSVDDHVQNALCGALRLLEDAATLLASLNHTKTRRGA